MMYFAKRKSLNLLDILKNKTAAYRVQPAELESATTRSQLQDRISCNSYQAAGTRVSCRTESATTHIQPPELELAVGRSQPQLVSSRRNSSQSAVTCIQPPALETAATRIQPPELRLSASDESVHTLNTANINLFKVNNRITKR